MLQVSEYRAGKYFKWFIDTDDFSKVITRQELIKTSRARAIMLGINAGVLIEILSGIILIILGLSGKLVGGLYFGLALIIIYPLVWSIGIGLLVSLARLVIINPEEKKQISSSKEIIKKHQAKKIAVLGSYGKTSMKELLTKVLGHKFKVASTPGNKNVAISHARFIKKLKGDEDFVIFEYGEGAPGDIAKFASNTHPDYAVITGISPAHLDKYKDLEDIGKDLFSINKFVVEKNVYVNYDSEKTHKFIKDGNNKYSKDGVKGFKVDNVVNSINGISFDLTNTKTKIHVKSKMLGRHQIAPLSLVAELAYEFGMNQKEIELALKDTESYEHRMKPYELSGATIIDDTYNGNLEGIRAGTNLLGELKARRKIYVTPGLVDQGKMNEFVHEEMGELIAKSSPDVVVLMKNSVTNFIKKGLDKQSYKGELVIQDNPLDFYKNLGSFVAQGDVVLMQNDWTDIYK